MFSRVLHQAYGRTLSSGRFAATFNDSRRRFFLSLENLLIFAAVTGGSFYFIRKRVEAAAKEGIQLTFSEFDSATKDPAVRDAIPAVIVEPQVELTGEVSALGKKVEMHFPLKTQLRNCQFGIRAVRNSETKLLEKQYVGLSCISKEESAADSGAKDAKAAPGVVLIDGKPATEQITLYGDPDPHLTWWDKARRVDLKVVVSVPTPPALLAPTTDAGAAATATDSASTSAVGTATATTTEAAAAGPAAPARRLLSTTAGDRSASLTPAASSTPSPPPSVAFAPAAAATAPHTHVHTVTRHQAAAAAAPVGPRGSSFGSGIGDSNSSSSGSGGSGLYRGGASETDGGMECVGGQCKMRPAPQPQQQS